MYRRATVTGMVKRSVPLHFARSAAQIRFTSLNIPGLTGSHGPVQLFGLPELDFPEGIALL